MCLAVTVRCCRRWRARSSFINARVSLLFPRWLPAYIGGFDPRQDRRPAKTKLSLTIHKPTEREKTSFFIFFVPNENPYFVFCCSKRNQGLCFDSFVLASGISTTPFALSWLDQSPLLKKHNIQPR
ncbi:hypothetical protein GmHk_15G043535 [Glycine max]|nr:hypothetical protein GmHk_15G043535 [Glycine max]KAH1208841.1 hypothetical protein GmHk_15G043535 [Glycine max]